MRRACSKICAPRPWTRRGSWTPDCAAICTGTRTAWASIGFVSSGHDCATFANQGVAMVFIRNDHGSHDSGHAMEIDDVAQCCRPLGALLEEIG